MYHTYNYEHLWFVDVISWPKVNKWKWIVLEKKLNLKIGHEEQNILIKYNFSNRKFAWQLELHL
jgi:hypothetical protein